MNNMLRTIEDDFIGFAQLEQHDWEQPDQTIKISIPLLKQFEVNHNIAVTKEIISERINALLEKFFEYSRGQNSPLASGWGYECSDTEFTLIISASEKHRESAYKKQMRNQLQCAA